MECKRDEKTLRMVIPQWQGGVNPNYVFGAELLAAIVPPTERARTVTVAVPRDFEAPLGRVDGVEGAEALLAQMAEERSMLEREQPNRVVVLGGDCAVEQAPFDWLNGRYGGDLGILWLDAHPDISSPASSTHQHEMVLGDLLGLSPDAVVTRVEHPFEPARVMLGGLIKEGLRPKDEACRELGLRAASPETLAASSEPVLAWLREEGIKRLVIHWDLDVLSPEDFRSIYPAEPGCDVEEFSRTMGAVGRMTLAQVGRLVADVSVAADVVGFGITEHLPWDAFNLRRTLAGIEIFSCEQGT